MVYTITCNYRPGVDEDERPWNENKDCGDFRSTIDFTVLNEDVEMNDEINYVDGIIVQYVQKSCLVDIYHPTGQGVSKTLNTSDEIYNYTSGNVKYMNYNYLEYFEVKNGISVVGDQFGNGPICEYEGNEPIIDDEQDMSQGEIVQNGFAVFIPEPMASNIKNGNISWNHSDDTPANGLPMIDFNSQIWEQIFAVRQSNVFVHSVKINWKYLNIIQKERSNSYIDNCNTDPQIINIQQMGGKRKIKKRKKTKKTKRTKKRKQ
jgi:hypothetical protein